MIGSITVADKHRYIMQYFFFSGNLSLMFAGVMRNVYHSFFIYRTTKVYWSKKVGVLRDVAP